MAFAAFRTYLSLGPRRTVQGAIRADNPERSVRTAYDRWSSQYRWVERATAYDEHLARVEDAQRVEATRENARKWAERRDTVLELEWQTGVRMLMRARKIAADERASLANVASVAEIGAKLCRRAAKMPSEIEAAPPQDWDSVLFESAGQVADALPEGVTPEMPADVLARPRVSVGASGDGVDLNGRVARQPGRPVRPE